MLQTYAVKNLVPIASEVVDVSAGDHTFTKRIHAIRCDAAGTVVAKLREDTTANPYNVAAGEVLIGEFVTVEKVGTTVTAAGALVGLKYPLV